MTSSISSRDAFSSRIRWWFGGFPGPASFCLIALGLLRRRDPAGARWGCRCSKLPVPRISLAVHSWIMPTAADGIFWGPSTRAPSPCPCPFPAHGLHVINLEVREIPVLSESEMLKFSFRTLAASSLWCSRWRYQRRASAGCLCIQDAISKPAPDVGSDIGQDRYLPKARRASRFPSALLGTEAHRELSHGCGRISSGRCPPRAAPSSPAPANVTRAALSAMPPHALTSSAN